MVDVTIIGGGPAGLSAAMILGRACRNVVVVDSMQPRNAASPRMHGYLTRDGIPPLDFLAIGREELKTYPNVDWNHAEATDCRRVEGGFEIEIADHDPIRSRFVILATGMADRVPDIPGVVECYGHSVHHCPYCDGWEHRGRRLVAFGQSENVEDYAIELTGWSPSVTLCTNGVELKAGAIAKLRQRRVEWIPDRIVSVWREDRTIQAIEFSHRAPLACDALFFQSHPRQRNGFARSLGCNMDQEDCLEANSMGETNIPGLFVAGNAKRGLNMVVMAVAEGARSAFSINEKLLRA